MATLTSVLGGCILLLLSALLAMASEKQLLFSGSGPPNECSTEHTYEINSCGSPLNGDCDFGSISRNIAEENSDLSNPLCININVAQVLLMTNATFFGLQSLTISGDPHLNTTINCQTGNNVGLVFNNISRLVLRRLTVTNCGMPLELLRGVYSSAVSILHGKDIVLESLTALKSVGIGLMIVDHQGGIVRVKSSNFTENRLSDSDSNIRGGGGVYVGDFTHQPLEPITFIFENCVFERNVAHTRYYDYLYTDDLGNPVSGYGLGGGAAVLLERGLNNIHVIFSGCTFTKNEAFKGAGFVAEIEGGSYLITRNMSVRVEHSQFEENGCSQSNPTASGGGIQVYFDTHNKTNFHSNQFILYNVTFIKNCAQFGGGLYFYSDHEINAEESNTFNIEECRFESNRAHTGSAVDITPNVFERLTSGILTTPVFKNCVFTNNTVIINFETNRTQTTYGIGTIYVSLYNVKFEGFNCFENNLGTAIHIVNGNIDASRSSVDFIKNRGIQGGAIALIGESSMVFGENRNYTFVNNTALDKGGAIYVQVVDNHDITASKTCFIQYYDGYSYIPQQNWNSTITFAGNRAGAGGRGHTVFATTLYSCQIINFGDKENLQLQSINTPDVFSLRGIFIQEDTRTKGYQVATEGAILKYDQESPLEVIPGEQFAHGVTIFDDLNNQATVVLTAAIQNNPNVELDAAFSSCVGEKIILKGKQGEYAYLYLHTTSSRLSYIRLQVKLIDCPPGFIFSETSSSCVCNSHKFIGMLGCNTTVFYSHLTPGFWVGMLSDAENDSNIELVTSYCPLNFCNYNDTTSTTGNIVKLPQRHLQLDEAMCGKSRTGVACGSCVVGYTTYFHSPKYQCRLADSTLCKVGWLFYILSELVPVTVVFITVLVLNISFTSGAVNGFILFSQLLSSLHIDASGIIVFPPAITNLMEGYKLIYGFFNLDFFQIESLSFCLWPNASALDMLAFKYVTIMYALLLVLLVIWFMNKCGGKYLGKWIRITTIKSSVIHGISAFLILCYSQCISISLNLLNTYPLYVREDSNFTAPKRVWLNGNILYFSKSHLPYALPALLCLLTVGTIPPLLLLAYPLSNKILAFFQLEESRVATFICQKLRISYLKPLLDSFQGSFKDNLRFFAGLYFLYRWIALILTITLSDFNLVYTAVEIFIVVILVLHALFQPYASRVHNMIDTLLFGNLAVINAFTFEHYYKFRTRSGRQAAVEYTKASASFQLVLIYLPLLIMAAYVVVIIFRIIYRQSSKKNAEWTTSISLQKLRSSFSKGDSSDEEELPHRLIAGAADYECFEDTDRITYATKEDLNTGSGIDPTY